MIIHTCEICGWTTNRIGNLRAHHEKQKKCKPPPIQEAQLPTVVEVNPNQCVKCEKNLSTANSLKQHMLICKGCHILQCPTCLKKFSSRASKSQHIKNIKCEPVISRSSKSQHFKNIKCEPVIIPEIIQEELERLQNENQKLTNKLDLSYTEIERLRLELLENRKPKPKPKPKRTFVTPITRLEIASSQTWCCSICTNSLPAYFEIDHTIPLWNDGRDIRENVTAVCIGCHGEKTHNERKLQGDMKHLNYIE
jgi:hypothetical protein